MNSNHQIFLLLGFVLIACQTTQTTRQQLPPSTLMNGLPAVETANSKLAQKPEQRLTPCQAPEGRHWTEESRSPDGLTAIVTERFENGAPDADVSPFHRENIPATFFVECKTGRIIGQTDISYRGFKEDLWNPSSNAVALVGNYSNPRRELRVYARQDDGTFTRILLDISETDSHLLDGSGFGGPYPFSLYQKKHQSRAPFGQVRDDAATIGWLNDRTAILLNLSWGEGEDSWPKEWRVPAVGASFKATITGTEAKISDVHLLGPMDSDDLVKLVRLKYARELRQ